MIFRIATVFFCFFVGLYAAPARADCTLPAGAVCGTGPCAAETRPTGHIIRNQGHDVLQVCQGDGTWHALTQFEPNPCAENPTPGTVCKDGSVYAGLSPDGNVRMFIAASDETASLQWGTVLTLRSLHSNITGQSNTTALIGYGPGLHPAADSCVNKSAHGYADWYLPARHELAVLWDMINIHGVSAGLTNNWYWSSSEATGSGEHGRILHLGTGDITTDVKTNSYPVRCVRKGA